jgi:hypothetical protein
MADYETLRNAKRKLIIVGSLLTVSGVIFLVDQRGSGSAGLMMPVSQFFMVYMFFTNYVEVRCKLEIAVKDINTAIRYAKIYFFGNLLLTAACGIGVALAIAAGGIMDYIFSLFMIILMCTIWWCYIKIRREIKN